MIRSIIIVLSLMKLILFVGCNTRDYTTNNPYSSAKLKLTDPAICSRVHMNYSGNNIWENLIRADLTDLKQYILNDSYCQREKSR